MLFVDKAFSFTKKGKINEDAIVDVERRLC